MKIVYISHLSTNISSGLNWSVPASVNAQSMIDKVLWVNMTLVEMEHWKKVPAYHNISEYDGRFTSMECLPSPFNNPDVVVFEGFYYMDDVRIAKMLRKKQIPYIIIPRGSLTKLALHNHAWFKKWVAHKLFFDGFVKNAAAVQYLTRQEADDSIGRFHTPYFIVPNGVIIPHHNKSLFSKDAIKAVFIGRLDMFQKGIDWLMDAINEICIELRNARFHLSIYGPKRYDYNKIGQEIQHRGISDVVSLHDEITGAEKEKVLLDADLFVLTSRFEGHPMGLIEALAYGLPCLVTPGSNMALEIGNSNAGWVAEGNKDSVKEKLLMILRESSSFAVKGRNAQGLAERYDWNSLAVLFHENIEKYVRLTQ